MVNEMDARLARKNAAGAGAGDGVGIGTKGAGAGIDMAVKAVTVDGSGKSGNKLLGNDVTAACAASEWERPSRVPAAAAAAVS